MAAPNHFFWSGSVVTCHPQRTEEDVVIVQEREIPGVTEEARLAG